MVRIASDLGALLRATEAGRRPEASEALTLLVPAAG